MSSGLVGYRVQFVERLQGDDAGPASLSGHRHIPSPPSTTKTCPCDIGCLIGGQEGYCCRYVLRRACPAQHDPPQCLLA